jgi:hypothetical protein
VDSWVPSGSRREQLLASAGATERRSSSVKDSAAWRRSPQPNVQHLTGVGWLAGGDSALPGVAEPDALLAAAMHLPMKLSTSTPAAARAACARAREALGALGQAAAHARK